MVRFSNSTRYGKGLLYDGENDPLADQARDMLVKRLVETEGFLVFERDNLGGLAFEKSLLEDGASEFVGVDAVIVGSVTEFGRKTEGQVGFLSSTKKQTVEAAVEARLVDPKSALAFFSASGKGEASTESGGGRQGLKVGDHFTVETLGEVIKSGQSGLPITLPGRSIAEIEVVSFFGDTEYSEGSVAQVVSGSLEGESERLIVREVK